MANESDQWTGLIFGCVLYAYEVNIKYLVIFESNSVKLLANIDKDIILG